MSAGTVVFLSANQSMVVVRHSDGYAVVELLGEAVEMGDQVAGDWEALGGETIFNRTQGARLDVFMQGTWGSVEIAVETARRTGGG